MKKQVRRAEDSWGPMEKLQVGPWWQRASCHPAGWRGCGAGAGHGGGAVFGESIMGGGASVCSWLSKGFVVPNMTYESSRAKGPACLCRLHLR